MSKSRDEVPVTSGVIGDAGELKALGFSIELRRSASLRDEYPNSGAERVDTRYVGVFVPEDFERGFTIQSASGGMVFEVTGLGDCFFP